MGPRRSGPTQLSLLMRYRSGKFGSSEKLKWSSRCEKYLVSYRYCCCWFGGWENLPRKRRAHLEEGDCDARDGWEWLVWPFLLTFSDFSIVNFWGCWGRLYSEGWEWDSGGWECSELRWSHSNGISKVCDWWEFRKECWLGQRLVSASGL